MMNTTTRWLLVLLVTLFSAGIATDNLAFAQSGDSNVPFHYEITRYWQHDTSMGSWPPIDLNDHGDAVVTPWYNNSDFSAELPLLYLSHEEWAAIYPLAEPDSDGNIDINGRGPTRCNFPRATRTTSAFRRLRPAAGSST